MTISRYLLPGIWSNHHHILGRAVTPPFLLQASQTAHARKCQRAARALSLRKTWGFPGQFIQINQGVKGNTTPQGRRLRYHTPEQVSNQEPPDSRPCVLTTTLFGPGPSSASLPAAARPPPAAPCPKAANPPRHPANNSPRGTQQIILKACAGPLRHPARKRRSVHRPAPPRHGKSPPAPPPPGLPHAVPVRCPAAVPASRRRPRAG